MDGLEIPMLIVMAKLAERPVLLYNGLPPATLAMMVELLAAESGKPPFPVMQFTMIPPGRVSVADEKSVPFLEKVNAARRCVLRTVAVRQQRGCAEGSD